MDRTATWECRVCPDDGQVLRPYVPHYPTKAAAEAGLRRHFVLAHSELLFDPSGQSLVSGDVICWSMAA